MSPPVAQILDKCAACTKPAGTRSQRYTLSHWWDGQCDVVLCGGCAADLRRRAADPVLIATGSGCYGRVKLYAGEIVNTTAHNVATGRVVPLASSIEVTVSPTDTATEQRSANESEPI